MKYIQTIFLVLFFSAQTQASILDMLADNSDHCTESKKVAVCDDEIIKKNVEWACTLIETTGKEALDDIKLMRFSCCNEPNYIWINDLTPKMVLHPVKSSMNGKDLSLTKDQNGNFLFVEMVSAINKTPDGAWVEYVWPKAGEKEPSPKKSWVKKCKVKDTNEYWLAGSGTWK